MEQEKMKQIVEAILFAGGRVIKIEELMTILEIGREDVIGLIEILTRELEERKSPIAIIKVEDGYQMTTKPEFHEFLYPIFDKRNKPNLSNAALETLAIIAYNPRITRAEVEAIRGVNSDGTLYKLLEYDLIQEAGKKDAPGRPNTYQTTEKFLKTFGYTTLKELPELPRYRLDENEQIVIDEVIEQNEEERHESI